MPSPGLDTLVPIRICPYTNPAKTRTGALFTFATISIKMQPALPSAHPKWHVWYKN